MMTSGKILTVALTLLAELTHTTSFRPILTKSKSPSINRIEPLFSTKSRRVELTSDNGVVKDIILPGQGRKIEAGDILAIEYAASVRGSPVPFAKGNKEQFIVKDGSLIKGWDIAIESMRIGEISKVTILNSYAYGTKGVSPVIPPGKIAATLHASYTFSKSNFSSWNIKDHLVNWTPLVIETTTPQALTSRSI